MINALNGRYCLLLKCYVEYGCAKGCPHDKSNN